MCSLCCFPLNVFLCASFNVSFFQLARILPFLCHSCCSSPPVTSACSLFLLQHCSLFSASSLLHFFPFSTPLPSSFCSAFLLPFCCAFCCPPLFWCPLSTVFCFYSSDSYHFSVSVSVHCDATCILLSKEYDSDFSLFLVLCVVRR